MRPQAAGGVAQVREKLGRRQEGKEGQGGGRDRLGEAERHLHRERPRQRDGEIEAGQQRAREGQTEGQKHESMWGKWTHTLRDRRIYTEVGKERKRERRKVGREGEMGD